MAIRVQEAASVRLDEIYRYTRDQWGEAQGEWRGGGRVGLVPQEAVAAAVRPVHGGPVALPRGDGGVRQRASLGAGDGAARA